MRDLPSYRTRSTRQKLRSVPFPRLSNLTPARLIIGAAVVIAVLIAVGVLIAVATGYFDREMVTTTVLDKERVCDSDADGNATCQYLIFTENGTYRLTDSIFAGRFSSSDAYGRIKRCHRYEIESYGFRFGLTSTYPNITEVTDLGRDESCEP
jgi:hypothetical protein